MHKLLAAAALAVHASLCFGADAYPNQPAR